ncbi:elongation factor P--(R)-beta-lysine ligase [Solemya velum gill symbiont]|uniref:elongation factor P--(R)-beta-lysine ligase n=1 Tax=Solemya velum gill symbiont TaxID=2340 RepID=UPI00099817FE|nr:elongation factor P--(R)-beta-lysine ligase [Solemya velum gill symbiont]
MSWQPAASQQMLRKRAGLLARVRDYFRREEVLEVETPIMSRYGNPDPAINSFRTDSDQHPEQYLHTSPEFPMKRLLASRSGSIYQICKVFREEETGRYHNPEFTMLEWYRIGFDHYQLMDDVEAMIIELLPNLMAFERHTFQTLFKNHVGLDPLEATLEELSAKAESLGVVLPEQVERDWLLDVLFDLSVGDWLKQSGGVFVYNYPASMASLAQISPQDSRVAERFELYIDGIELANGFHELLDAAEQKTRFEKDLASREAQGMDQPPIDQDFLDALAVGLPDCSGVALGLDRLLMLQTGAEHIKEVIAFPG